MPEHIHLIIQPHLKRYNISDIMKYLKGSFGISYNKLIRKSGPIWQSRFFDTVLRTDQDLITRLNYTLQNPVRRGIIKEAKDYPYSSARVYFLGEEGHITDKYVSN